MDESKVAIFLVSSVYKFVYNKKKIVKLVPYFQPCQRKKRGRKPC